MEAFGADVGKKPGTVVWRIENFEPVLVPPSRHVTLYSGDSYVVLHTTETTGGKLSHDIYFWLGSETTQDESTSAATHAVMLDDLLGGAAVQHREVCGQESAGFLKVFKRLRVRKGGKATALAHVGQEEYPSRLVQVKLGRGLLVAEVELASDSLNSGDSFVLDTQDTVFLWHGPKGSPREKAKALDVAVGIRDEDRAGAVELVVVDGADVTSADALAFYKALGVADPTALTLKDAAPDADAASAFEAPRLFTVAGGAFSQVQASPLVRGLLKADGIFFLVAAGSVWVWTGKAASADIRTAASELGAQFVRQQQLPASTSVKVTKENLEPALFKLHFRDWPQDELLQYVRQAKAPQEAAPQDTAALASAMLTAPPSEEEKAMFTGGGTTRVWLVAAGSDKLQEVPEVQVGQLHDADCYVVQYSYPTAGGAPSAVIYYWLGRNSSIQEQATAALVATNLHQGELKGRSTLVRVAQGSEPAHFHRAFAGPLIIHDGDAGGQATGGARLYHVKGDTSREALAVEVAPVAASLNSGDCFVLLGTAGASCCWAGKYSSQAERQAAGEVAEALGGEATVVEEGAEDAAFWDALGGKAEYATFSAGGAPKLVPRLFQVSSAGTGRVAVTPIPAFSQDDLSDGDVMLLDTYSEVFVWVGSSASAAEQAAATELAQQYVAAAAATDGRSPSTAITRVEAGAEPPIFTANFAGWDTTKRATIVDPYEAKLAALKEQQAARPKPTPPSQPEPAAPAVASAVPAAVEEKEPVVVEEKKAPVVEAVEEKKAPVVVAVEEEKDEGAAPVAVDKAEEEPQVAVQEPPVPAAAAAVAHTAVAEVAQPASSSAAEHANGNDAAAAVAAAEEPATAPAAAAAAAPVTAPTEPDLEEAAPAAAPAVPAVAEAPAATHEAAAEEPAAAALAPSSPAPAAASVHEAEADPAAASPRVSVTEIARLMANREAEVEAQPTPKPVSVEPRTWTNGTKGQTSSEATPTSAPTTPVKPVVLTAHDTKNTANVAQILSAGSFEKVPLQDFLPYSELVGMRLEDGIDVSRKEDYLADDDFKTVFGFTRDEFKKMPSWRQIQTKKKHLLF